MRLDWDKLRSGQKRAIELIRDRVRDGEKYTSVVLPTRYGKSDVIRLSSLLVQDEGLSPCSLVLSPNGLLKWQIADTARWKGMLQRYDVKLSKPPQVTQLHRPVVRPNANGEVLLSATMQLIQRNVDIFGAWVESERHRTGLPVVVFIDESHTGSETNEWGRAVEVLVKKYGAYAVLLTATPQRSDSVPILGFGTEVMEDETVQIWKTSPSTSKEGWVNVKLFEGVKTKLRLKPDLNVKFREAFNEGALCKVSRTPFDAELEDGRGRGTRLSELSPHKVQSELGRIVRLSEVIEDGCRRLVADMRRRREVQPDSAGIVFCGNDTGPHREVDLHAKQIKKDLNDLGPEFEVRIITTSSNEEDASEDLVRFANGKYDIVIVKQMGGVGLDVPRLKTGLDLSPTRKFASLVQRMMRIATPYGNVIVGTWITPDDILSKAVFQRIVRDEGGEAASADLLLIDEYEKEARDPRIDLPMLLQGVTLADFEDTAGNAAARERWDTALAVLHAFPCLGNDYSHAEIVSRLETIDAHVAEDDPTLVIDSGGKAAAIRDRCNELTSDCIAAYRELNQIPYSSQAYGEVSRKIWGEAYAAAQWPRGKKLEEVSDITQLERVESALERMREALRRKGFG